MKNFSFFKFQVSTVFLIVALCVLLFLVGKSFYITNPAPIQACATPDEPVFACGNVMTEEESEGSDIFRKNCERCHYSSDKKLTGPGLKDVSERIPKKPDNWLRLYLTNADSSIFKDDLYVKSLRKEYKHTSSHSHVPFRFSDTVWEYLLLYLNSL